MNCLHCGDCCRRMSPISQPRPCPHIVEIGDFIFCGIYESRPQQCRDHDFPSSKCPIGCDVLKIASADAANIRINRGYAMIRKGLKPLERGDIWW